MANLASIMPVLGARPDGARLQRLAASPNYREGRFVNALPRRSDGASLGTAWKFFTGGSPHRRPEHPIPVERRTASDFGDRPEAPRVTWLGHSTFILELAGVRVLVDPVWGERASPIGWFGAPRFYQPPLPLDELPEIDAVVISHDHYDHLDYPTVQALRRRVPRWIVPLGVGSHLEKWGVQPDRIEELDWWDETRIDRRHGSVRLVSTPARHFSGRGPGDRDKTLWCGWAFLTNDHRVWYSGDSALTPEFTEIGHRLGPFDLSLVEIGAYDAAWADVHLGPEQAVAAYRMAQGEADGGVLIPVHWGLFDLALHGWTEPAERLRAAAASRGISVAFPRPGGRVTLEAVPVEPWWPTLPWNDAEEAPAVSTGLPDTVLEYVPTP